MSDFKKNILNLKYLEPNISQVIFFEKIDSTNEKAYAYAKKGEAIGTLMIAETQSQGHGRFGRRWHSPANTGLYFSLILKPNLKPTQAPLINLATGLALQEAIKTWSPIKTLLKWPNDLLIQGKKVAGILSEIMIQNNTIQFLVLGVGINVGPIQEKLPATLKNKASSLEELLGFSVNRIELLRVFLKGLFHEIQSLEDQGSRPLLQRWETNSGFIGCDIQAEQEGMLFQGQAVGLNERGELILKLPDGKLIELIAADTSLSSKTQEDHLVTCH